MQNQLISQQITTANPAPESSHELLKIILDFVGTIIWPVVVLLIVFHYKKEIQKLLTRAKKVELPGGFSIETIDEEIENAKELADEVKKERKPDYQKIFNEPNSFESEANKRMVRLGLTPSPSGLDINYYKKIADIDPRLSLIGLRSDLEIMLKNLAKGFKVDILEREPASKIMLKLQINGAITRRQYELINKLFKICNSAAHGIGITKDQALEVLDIGDELVKDYIAWLYWGFDTDIGTS